MTPCAEGAFLLLLEGRAGTDLYAQGRTGLYGDEVYGLTGRSRRRWITLERQAEDVRPAVPPCAMTLCNVLYCIRAAAVFGPNQMGQEVTLRSSHF